MDARLKWWVIPLVLVVGGCQTTEDLKFEDRTFFWSVRVTHDLSGSARTDGDENGSRLAVELDLHHAGGTGSQSLEASHVIDIGGSELIGPAAVESDYDLLAGSLAIRAGLNDPTDRSRAAVLLGLSVQDFGLHASAGTVSADDHRRSLGPLVGVDGSLDLAAWSAVYGRGSLAIGLTDATTTLSVVELGLSLRPFPHVALAGGYRWQRYTQPRLLSQMMGFDDTRIDLKLHGAVVGLHVDF